MFQAPSPGKKDLLEIPGEVKIQFNEEPSIHHKAYSNGLLIKVSFQGDI